MVPPEYYGSRKKQSACSSFLHYTWKIITCLFSHITLVTMVVSYCVLGAFTFEALEVNHEKEVKRNISKLRRNVTDHLWKLTSELDVLEPENFTRGAVVYLREFEAALLKAMTKDGWDGEEDVDKVQWTSTGALFYSIIVITTIGYGHIAPKTTWGKVVTIFYAILGIPLMLLCLSNIGDIMATSFRFLYWRVCCYVCTKKPKKTRRNRGPTRISSTRSSRTASIRRQARPKSTNDSGFGLSELATTTETNFTSHQNNNNISATYGIGRAASVPARTKSLRNIDVPRRGQSLDRRRGREIDSASLLLVDKSPILCNRYVVGPEGVFDVAPQQRTHLAPPVSAQAPQMRYKRKYMSPSPKMMTPLGYGHRSKYLDDPDTEDEEDDEGYALDESTVEGGTVNYYNYYDENYYEIPMRGARIKPVPIWLCVFLVVSYIVAGAFLFNSWETWDLLDAAYFCFITLTTIGFGDLVPAKGVSQDGYRATVSIALCSLYLLFGIALLAMSFNLVQEEVIANVKSVARTLGIIKTHDSDSEDDQ